MLSVFAGLGMSLCKLCFATYQKKGHAFRGQVRNDKAGAKFLSIRRAEMDEHV